ncbi:2-oxoacid:ferredoxin oxidoreductase subunit beta [Plasticicumulans acidivorans]|uniref:2-oxoglutarate ferredoxin oxidoreductase subunit beta n=1 Tax=Plasticicumulans acidivorans TaxID=886464 RepID=A0A317MUQ2_9GAMM|nr:2-oxoacid:ferredoxin oxidoreductase subunit beta [Plasticicumulans acidivorans]PWV61638.1 2-oxoglutarate ferredoxin oxidoreductase subunit beta [Plasticicumulans acidivorans]
MDAVTKPKLKAKDYQSDIKPVWCRGCGAYSVIASITRALAELQLPREEVAFVSGIGCSSRIPAYASVYGFHGVHGRALPLATGLKIARPELTVLAAGGDGDGFSIGGNHFMHACRRNADITYIVMDNGVYGMTKGQASPTAAPDWTGSVLTPDGPGVPAFRPLEIALAAGASFVARSAANDPAQMKEQIVAAIRHPGFALIHVLCPCVTYRPEQQDEFKARAHADWQPTGDRGEAFNRALVDDGYTTGMLYIAPRPVYAAHPAAPATLDEIAAEFTVG